MFWHSKMCTLIRYIINEILVEIQKFRHEWSLIWWKYSTSNMNSHQLCAKDPIIVRKWRSIHNFQSYLDCRYIKMWYTYNEIFLCFYITDVNASYETPLILLHFWVFSDIIEEYLYLKFYQTFADFVLDWYT